jgi:hypothetical protein
MSRKKAIEICKNLKISINNSKDRDLQTKLDMFHNPTACKSKLTNKYNYIREKYDIQDECLNE